VLKNQGLLPPNEALYQLLIRKYFDNGNVREINYFSFCQDIDRPEDISTPYVAKNPTNENSMAMGQLRDAGNTFFEGPTESLDIINNRFRQKRIEIANNPSDVETRLQAQVVMKRVRIEEFFIDYDKLRKMKVTKN